MLYRATVVLKHKSGQAKDNVTNTFHVDALGGGPQDAEDIAEQIRDKFFLAIPPNSEFGLSTYLGGQIADAGHEIRMYPLVTATGESTSYQGAPPEHVELFDFIGRNDEGTGLPSEVALCCSFRRLQSGNVPLAQRTGRVYFGPIEASHIAVGAEGSRPKPTDALRGTLAEAGNALIDGLAAAGNALVVYSRPFAGRVGAVKDNGDPKPDLPARAGSIHVVNQVFVDDAFDTQRRRGEKSTLRSIINV